MPFYSLCFQNRNLPMYKLLAVFAVSLVLAYLSEQNTKAILSSGRHYSVWNDWAYLLLVTVLVLFAGLRTGYNDTWNYMNGFRNSNGLEAFLLEPKNLNIFRNPLFYFCHSALRDVTGNAQWLIFISAAITQVGFLRFFKRYSHNFTFTIFIFFTLGTINVSLAALKQMLAMAIATLAFPYLERKQWLIYYVIIFIAMLIHTYALAFGVLPFFRQRPWTYFTYLFVLALVVLMLNFKEAISAFMDQADELGKTLYEEEIFDENTVNILRVAVYAVAPIVSFFFAHWIFRGSNSMDHTLVHMSIISFAFMVMGTQSGANMFARMAHYFELATACCLPWMLKQTFEKKSYRLVSIVAALCFLGYFVYANAINMRFDEAYKAGSIFTLLGIG